MCGLTNELSVRSKEGKGKKNRRKRTASDSCCWGGGRSAAAGHTGQGPFSTVLFHRLRRHSPAKALGTQREQAWHALHRPHFSTLASTVWRLSARFCTATVASWSWGCVNTSINRLQQVVSLYYNPTLNYRHRPAGWSKVAAMKYVRGRPQLTKHHCRVSMLPPARKTKASLRSASKF
jgi:hypothetical protein